MLLLCECTAACLCLFTASGWCLFALHPASAFSLPDWLILPSYIYTAACHCPFVACKVFACVLVFALHPGSAFLFSVWLMSTILYLHCSLAAPFYFLSGWCLLSCIYTAAWQPLVGTCPVVHGHLWISDGRWGRGWKSNTMVWGTNLIVLVTVLGNAFISQTCYDIFDSVRAATVVHGLSCGKEHSTS